MGRELGDIDIVVDGDVKAAARRLAVEAGGPAFPLSARSSAPGASSVPTARGRSTCRRCAAGRSSTDLAQRDFTVNAIAEPLHGGALVDPHDGAADLAAFRLRMVSEAAFADDPLRVLRLARFACELGLEPDPDRRPPRGTTSAGGISEVAPERVFAELRRIVGAERVLEGLELAERLGVHRRSSSRSSTAMRGVAQNRFHHLDAADHTLAVLQAVVDLEADPGAVRRQRARRGGQRAARPSRWPTT